MRQFQLFSPRLKEDPKDEVAKNSILLRRAGYVDKVMAGVYHLLPLGLRVVSRIVEIVRQEMNRLGAQEVLLSALHPKELWEKTGRFATFDVLFKVQAMDGALHALGPTHEEVIFPLVQKAVKSYNDLPLALYQIQTKFRSEPRAKSGLLRGKEFLMKDLYSFHTSTDDVERFKKKVEQAYMQIYRRCGVRAIQTRASGGTFSKYSTEFQVVAEIGEDTVYICNSCRVAYNEEVAPPAVSGKRKSRCPECAGVMLQHQGIEVGNTFNLGTKFSDPFHVVFADKDGVSRPVFAGCYGLGISRLLGALVEVWADERGLVWPLTVAPFLVHIVPLASGSTRASSKILATAEMVYTRLSSKHVDVLIDDRNVSSGQKLVESDLLGIPWRIVVSERTVAEAGVEVKSRMSARAKLVSLKQLPAFVEKQMRSQS